MTTTAPTAPIFQIDVSRTYRNKEGYKAGGYKLNTSFVTETHTPESFLNDVVKPGWPYTMVHHKRSPEETGAAARGVVTPKHTENCIGRQELTGDDDSAAPGVIDFWLSDPFFREFGFAFVESVNSIPGQAEKGHPTFIFDRMITDPDLYREMARGLVWYYSQQGRELDSGIHNIDRTIYNAEGARIHHVGNICPLDEFISRIVEPYRAHLAEVQAKAEAERQARLAEWEAAQAAGRAVTDDSTTERYLKKTVDGIFNYVASTPKGANRHRAIYNAGRMVGELLAADWATPFGHLLSDYTQRIIAATEANGYMFDHAHGRDSEVLRTFEDGLAMGRSTPAEPPRLYRTDQGTVKSANQQPGYTLPPYELSEDAKRRRAEYLAKVEAKRAESEPAYKPDIIPFMLTPEDYASHVIPRRQAIGKAQEWRLIVELDYPELDPETEYRRKKRENRQKRIDECGRPFQMQTATGETVTRHMMCGICDTCKEYDRNNLRQHLEAEFYSLTAPRDIYLLTVATEDDRRALARQLTTNETLYTCYPVDRSGGVEFDFLIDGAYPEAELLDPITLPDRTINEWLDRPEGYRSSGKLIPGIRDLRKSDPMEFEVTDPYKRDEANRIIKDSDGQPELRADIVVIDLPGIITNTDDLPEPPAVDRVGNLAGLQAALFEAHQTQLNQLRRAGYVISGVVNKKLYTSLNDIDAIIELFNAAQDAKRGPDPG